MTTATLLSSDEVCALTGLTYRQLDYYTRNGVLTPRHEARGSGHQRRWTADQVPQVIVVARTSNAMRALSGIERAGNLALYKAVAENWAAGRLDMGEGVTLTWEVPEWQST